MREGRYAARVLSYDELTPPERELWEAFPAGRRVDLRTGVPGEDRVTEGWRWGPARSVRAAVIVALLLGAHTTQPGAVACLRLAGARISGQIGASLRTLVITGSRVPGIEADSARIEGILDLRGSVV